jgi:hypothetical protein
VACVAPDLPDGAGDYDRFVRKHDHLYAPSEDGQLEAGPTHVHPALGPFAPPPAAAFAAVNRDVAARARDYERARTRWRIGAPYRGEERDTLVVRARAGSPVQTEPAEPPPRYPLDQRVPLALGSATAAVGGAMAALAAEPLPLLAAAALPAGLAVAAVRLRRVRAELADALPLDRAAPAAPSPSRSPV